MKLRINAEIEIDTKTLREIMTLLKEAKVKYQIEKPNLKDLI